MPIFAREATLLRPFIFKWSLQGDFLHPWHFWYQQQLAPLSILARVSSRHKKLTTRRSKSSFPANVHSWKLEGKRSSSMHWRPRWSCSGPWFRQPVWGSSIGWIGSSRLNYRILPARFQVRVDFKIGPVQQIVQFNFMVDLVMVIGSIVLFLSSSLSFTDRLKSMINRFGSVLDFFGPIVHFGSNLHLTVWFGSNLYLTVRLTSPFNK